MKPSVRSRYTVCCLQRIYTLTILNKRNKKLCRASDPNFCVTSRFLVGKLPKFLPLLQLLDVFVLRVTKLC
jgi:hypothetical protein